jgi:hypothetical protein
VLSAAAPGRIRLPLRWRSFTLCFAKADSADIDRARVLLGCLQPGQTSSLYSDALNRLADQLHYLNSSGDRTMDATRYWFDTRANLRREMEVRKKRYMRIRMKCEPARQR